MQAAAVARCGCSAGSAMGLAAVLLILTYTPLGMSVNGNRNWLDLGSSRPRHPAGRVRQAGAWSCGAPTCWPASSGCSTGRSTCSCPFLPVCRAAHPAGRLPGRRRHRGGDGRDRRRRAVDRRRADAGAGRACWRARGRRRGRPVRHQRRSGCAGSPPSSTRRPTSTASTTRPTPACSPSPPAAGGASGLGASRQKWGSLPEAHTDFIFAVLGEEFGLFGSLVVLALFGVLGYAGIRIATRSDDPFARYAAGGVTTWFMVAGAVQPGRRAAAAADRRRAAAAGLLRRLGPDRQPAGRRACCWPAPGASRPPARCWPSARRSRSRR